MKRRTFLKAIAAAGSAIGLSNCKAAVEPVHPTITITLPISKARPTTVRWEGSDSFDFAEPHPIECVEQVGNKLALLTVTPKHRFIRFVVSGPEPTGQIALTNKLGSLVDQLHIMTSDDILDFGYSFGNVLYVRNIK